MEIAIPIVALGAMYIISNQKKDKKKKNQMAQKSYKENFGNRKINTLLKYELENGVHALSLHLFTQSEWKTKEEYVKDSPPCAS